MLKLISKLLGGNKSEKDVARISPLVEKINGFFAQYQTLTNDELRGKTQEFKQRIKTHLTDIDAQILAKQDEADNLPATDIHEKDAIYHKVDELKKY